MKRTTLEQCPDAAGSINNLTNPVPSSYVAPELCVGTFTISQGECADIENRYQESLASAALNASGAPLNVFKLLGNHEQGKLIDLVGNGVPISSGGTAANAFDELADDWVSDTQGLAVLTSQTYIGYDFGIRRTSFGQPENAPGVADAQHITSFRIKQSQPNTRALQVRVDRSDGDFCIDDLKITFTGTGNGWVGKYTQGFDAVPGTFMLFADSPTKFTVMFNSASRQVEILGQATVNTPFLSKHGSFTISSGTIPFAAGDSFSVPVQMNWKRVDVVNLPNMDAPALVRINQSAASRYWRLVPTSFAGATTNDPWVVEKLELFDFQATRLDDVQDPLFMENRDRDYAKASIQLRAAYTPFDAVSDMSKFGFQMADVYSFSVSFADMVRALGRPIVVGDILEVPSEMQYDHNLKPVRKFLEVEDTGWAADGFTTGWKPIIFKFQAQQLIPGQEHRDLLGTADTQKYVIDDATFFEGIEQIQTAPLTVSEANQAEAVKNVPEKGTNTREFASGTNRFNQPGSYDGVGLYVEDGLPPDGKPYETGFKLPDVAGQTDGAYFRLEYDPKLMIPARLYKFSIMKNKWIYVETDRRSARSALRPSQLEILNMDNMSPTSKIIR